MKKNSKLKKKNIYNEYRRILQQPNLTDKEIDKIRSNMVLLAQAVCEHVWKKKFY